MFSVTETVNKAKVIQRLTIFTHIEYVADVNWLLVLPLMVASPQFVKSIPKYMLVITIIT